MKYTKKFINLYCGLRHVLTNKGEQPISCEITSDDTFKMYVLEAYLEEYYNIKCTEPDE